ncbi:MAG: hypothetical protein IAE94_00795 [Chthoniobacterales bacterium]|nr:hypothetical protein [Chthoniobacterales bacterium]
MKSSRTTHHLGKAAVVALLTCLGTSISHATDYYWDSNGTTAGAGTDPTGTWGTNSFCKLGV